MGYLSNYEERNVWLRRNEDSPLFGHVAAWRLFAKLMRRHPGEFDVLEEKILGDDYSQWTLLRRGQHTASGKSEPLIRVNPLVPVLFYTHDDTHQLKKTEEGLRSEVFCPMSEGEFRWPNAKLSVLELYYSDDFDWLVRDIEGCLGIDSPELTPITDHTSIGPRFIFEAIRKPDKALGSLVVRACVPDHYAPRFLSNFLFDQLSHISELERKMITREIGAFSDDELEEAKQIFYLHEVQGVSEVEVIVNTRPLLAVNISSGMLYVNTSKLKGGTVITEHLASPINLVDEYQAHGRDIKALVQAYLSKMEPPEKDDEASVHKTENQSETLDPKDKELFLKEWGFAEGELSDQEILQAIRLGYL